MGRRVATEQRFSGSGTLLVTASPSPSQSQYVFVYNALLEAVMCGETCVSVQGLRNRIEELGERVDTSEQTRFEVEFENLVATSCEVEFTCDVAARQQNMARNRYQTNLPSECTACLPATGRVCLRACLFEGVSLSEGVPLAEGVLESMSVLECMLSVSLALGDSARVVLIGKEEEENDYINASYIDVSRVVHTRTVSLQSQSITASHRATTARGPS